MVHTWVTGSSVPGSALHKGAAGETFKSAVDAKDAKAERAGSRGLFRGLFFLFAFLILFSGFTIMHTTASTGQIAPASDSEQIVSVQYGDTLWQLAEAYKRDSLDTRAAVHAIKKRNGLPSADLQIGQSLIIPEGILP